MLRTALFSFALTFSFFFIAKMLSRQLLGFTPSFMIITLQLCIFSFKLRANLLKNFLLFIRLFNLCLKYLLLISVHYYLGEGRGWKIIKGGGCGAPYILFDFSIAEHHLYLILLHDIIFWLANQLCIDGCQSYWRTYPSYCLPIMLPNDYHRL